MSKMIVMLGARAPVITRRLEFPTARKQWLAQGAGRGSSSCVGQRSNCETNSFFHAENILIPVTL